MEERLLLQITPQSTDTRLGCRAKVPRAGVVRGLAEPFVQEAAAQGRRGGAARIKIGQSIAFEVASALQAENVPQPGLGWG